MTVLFSECEIREELASVVARARLGCRDAMGELFRRFEKHVMNIAFKRLGDWEEAQDLCQDAFCQAFRKLDQLDVDAAFAGWLTRIVIRMSINRSARRHRTASVDHEVLEATLAIDHEASDEAIRGEHREHVRLGLQRLGELDRATLSAFYLDGQSLLEMSDRFEAPVGTIKRRLHTARKRLAEECKHLSAI